MLLNRLICCYLDKIFYVINLYNPSSQI
uniref:Uncharacterized protein n=1 Tax=Arundo donax TaxID=35708 RepID=A0A0A9C4K8_ARUDO